MTNKHQKNMPKTSTGPGFAVPDAVAISMSEITDDEIADDMCEGLLALAVGPGLQVMGLPDEGRWGRDMRAAGQARP